MLAENNFVTTLDVNSKSVDQDLRPQLASDPSLDLMQASPKDIDVVTYDATETKDLNDSDMSEVDEEMDLPDEHEQFDVNKVNFKVKKTTVQKSWKMPDVLKQDDKKEGVERVVRDESELVNKFKTQPNKFHYNMNDKFIGQYKGLDASFWKAYKTHGKGICHIEESIKLRT